MEFDRNSSTMTTKSMGEFSGLLELQAGSKVSKLVQLTQKEAEGYSQNTNTYSIASRVRKVLTKIVMAPGGKPVVVADFVPKL